MSFMEKSKKGTPEIDTTQSESRKQIIKESVCLRMSKVKAKKNSRLGRNGAELGQEGLSFTDGISKLHSEKYRFFFIAKSCN